MPTIGQLLDGLFQGVGQDPPMALPGGIASDSLETPMVTGLEALSSSLNHQIRHPYRVDPGLRSHLNGITM